MKDIFTGKLVRLSAYDVEEMTRTSSRWIQNSEYQRLISSSPFPMRSWNAVSKELEEEVGELSPAGYFFSIRTLAEDSLIGDLNLDVIGPRLPGRARPPRIPTSPSARCRGSAWGPPCARP